LPAVRGDNSSGVLRTSLIDPVIEVPATLPPLQRASTGLPLPPLPVRGYDAPIHRDHWRLPMQYTTLGKTGLKVSVAGLGCGGNSRIGLGAGKSEAESAEVVRAALDLGVNYFDTAALYGTEPILGHAIGPGERAGVVISTKAHIHSGDRKGNGVLAPADVVASLDRSLRNLKTDYVDVFMLHGVAPAALDPARSDIVPALLAEKAKGKFRHLGITETAARDADHTMLDRALEDARFEVVMLAFHMMHQNARRLVFPRTQAKGVGTLLMFVVRNIFSRPEVLSAALKDLAAAGKIASELGTDPDPLGFLVHPGGAESLIDAAYRFVRHEPGVDVVLFGTSSIGHLKSNVASILRPPLPEADVARLRQLFGHLVGVGLDLPDYIKAKG
jgi:aryl-alcohol dehydrogenase-like predicted oxidoreductase